ncbi:hypothetical protein N0V93_008219 [Gnomoniopsis smithogilvyi]|uniref:Cutinase n=1 Tax=Gnomoniopsis smithogilvyi TaxID=1191159 RepID=A0A9W8YLK3_9PEZI|nr:hypothetical protein N0V93_008219 [Gnomoniopsis smithogilvyi]
MKTSSSFLVPLVMGASALAYPQAVSPRNIEPRVSTDTILDLISEVFPSEIDLADSTDTTSEETLNTADGALAVAADYSTTANDLVDGECGDVTLIFARGTSEAGNVGSLVGPEFYSALQTALGSTSSIFQGVNDYSATIVEYLGGGSTTGAANMASLVTQAFSQCPGTQVVMSGYSQGAQVTHLTAADLPAATMQQVSAVVTFGDPDSTTPVANIDASKVLVICHDGDDICQFGTLVLPQHLTYAENATAAANWVVGKLTL